MDFTIDLVIIGGGPAGLAAALEAQKSGCPSILILERDTEPGGILNQCIHNGFGLHYFQEELTGPEYAGRFIDQAQEAAIPIKTDTMVLSLHQSESSLILQAVNPYDGYFTIQAKAVVLAMGCRERPRGAIGISGSRPAGIYTAGCAQRLINMEGAMVGRRAIILGSGDIGLIMARRMVLEGAEVLGCVELMPYSGGLQRNITQCLEDFNIPLYLLHTITHISGKNRVEQVTIAQVDESRHPISGTETVIDCDTVLLSVGLIPENELSRQAGIAIDPRTNGPLVDECMQTSMPGVFACGNVVHVHDLVDFVTLESKRAGHFAALYTQNQLSSSEQSISLKNGENVAYTVPQHIHISYTDPHFEICFRVKTPLRQPVITVTNGNTLLWEQKRAHMAPGEMEKISLPVSVLSFVPLSTSQELVISVHERI